MPDIALYLTKNFIPERPTLLIHRSAFPCSFKNVYKCTPPSLTGNTIHDPMGFLNIRFSPMPGTGASRQPSAHRVIRQLAGYNASPPETQPIKIRIKRENPTEVKCARRAHLLLSNWISHSEQDAPGTFTAMAVACRTRTGWNPSLPTPFTGYPTRLPEAPNPLQGNGFRNYTRKIVPSVRPSIRLHPMMVTARKTIDHTPSAEAVYCPVPISWKSS